MLLHFGLYLLYRDCFPSNTVFTTLTANSIFMCKLSKLLTSFILIHYSFIFSVTLLSIPVSQISIYFKYHFSTCTLISISGIDDQQFFDATLLSSDTLIKYTWTFSIQLILINLCSRNSFVYSLVELSFWLIYNIIAQNLFVVLTQFILSYDLYVRSQTIWFHLHRRERFSSNIIFINLAVNYIFHI
jgi:hypothetical protein